MQNVTLQVVEYYPEIKQFKIIQENKEAILFEYVVDEFFAFKESVLDEIKSKIDLLTDKTLKIEFKKLKSKKRRRYSKTISLCQIVIGGTTK